MPARSEAQRRAMFSAAAGKGQLGIPRHVAEEFAESDPGGKLPERAKDMSATKWSVLKRLFLEWINEEEREPEHGADAETKHDPKTGQFTGGQTYARAHKAAESHGFKYTGENDKGRHTYSHGSGASLTYGAGGGIGRSTGGYIATVQTGPNSSKTEHHQTWPETAVRGAIRKAGISKGEAASDDQFALSTEPNSGLPAALTTVKPKGRAASILFAAPNGNVLFVKRAADEENYPGHWSLPGGKADGDEDFGDCARREANEELGGDCSFDGMEELHRSRTKFGWDHVTFRVPAAAEFAPTLNGEHSEFAWASPSDPPTPLHPAVAATLEGLDQDNDAGGAEDIGPYPVRAQDAAGRWAYDSGLLAEAARRARLAGRADLARRAEAIRKREFGAQDAETAHDPKTGQFTSRSSGQPVKGKHVSQMNRKEREELARQSLTTRTANGLYHHPQHGYFRIEDQALDETHLNSHLVPHYWDWAMGGKSGTGAEQTKMSRAVKAERGLKRTGAADTLLLAMDKRIYDSDGHLHVDTSHISKAAINEYLGEEIPNWRKLRLDPKRRYKLLRDPAELEKAVDTFRNLPILSEHVPIDADTHDPDLVIGSTGSDPRWNPPYLDNSIVIWPRKAIDEIESKSRFQLSSAYRYVPKMTPGTYQGRPYDGIMTALSGSHLALVEEGRAGADVAVGDSLRDPWGLLERAILRVGGVI